jgi:fatty acid synthase, animal type
MMLERKQVLPNGYFETPSTKINFEKYNLRVPVAVEDMVPHDPKQGIIVSIASYGFGGMHIILHFNPLCWLND